jgi:FlaA1/EpsC-like NDP-sugar epimerase
MSEPGARPLSDALRRWLEPTGLKRILFFVAADLVVVALAMVAAFELRFDGRIPQRYWHSIPIYILLAIGPIVFANSMFRLYNITWRFVGARDVVNVCTATFVGTAVWGLATFLLQDTMRGTNAEYAPLPRSILALFFVLTLVGVGGVRMLKRLLLVSGSRGRKDEKRLLVVGGARTGERLIYEMLNDRVQGYRVVGVIDDDPNKAGTYLHGVRVLGGREILASTIRDEHIDEVLVAMPGAAGAVVRQVVVAARTAGAPVIRILPSMTDVLQGRIGLSNVREVQVEDLLNRAPVWLDMVPVTDFLFGRTVLVTGAAGSIGSELARQIATFSPGRMVVLDQNESNLFALELELRRLAPVLRVFAEIADVRDRERMRQVFATYRPQAVFHAAAYKHVPMMEAHPQEAVLTNVLGTKVIAEAASEAGAESFVLISTDKAVNPSSVMGATKRAAEMVVRRLNETSATRFVAVRFGNVLGSRGSVVPILEDQIRRGGPITVTHPDMERYFMTVPESVRLILKAASLGTGGEVFVLDMGEPVRIVDLAEALIRLSGFEPDVDVPIQFSGIRPGEKLREEILMAEEGIDSTKVEQIHRARLGIEPDPAALEQAVSHLEEAALQGDPARIRALLQDLVVTYRPGPGGESDEMFAGFLEVAPADVAGGIGQMGPEMPR